ncbi:aminotransferase class I/II-fold pyridoxal phosphate-dependent enzyme [Pygmaiobacter massiliensis]|uniref:aminotransferase class I/II-fold pyridoxal phosphate-dependent enzyme n=1 Tax=Pygmaiobacter massiliensis TaxID=1917873 RepID=UPI002A8253E4|nr:aminotransferase class I/II-fold pyridoxal phosphate-dependent enzyme [Pygmaiobacter massiliensis]MDY4783595.1 aminotransferase class I/II-fold pyridoxal phosphate-dependent enzyme [Pygmaiobacter massiliensis]
MNYESIIARRAAEIKPSGIRKFFDLAATMQDCISLGVGEPDFKTPWMIRDAGIKSLERGKTWYTNNAGLPEVRNAIADYLERRFDLSYDPATEIAVTTGGSEAIDLALRALLNSGEGEEVIIPEPCYVSYAPLCELCGGVPVPMPLHAEDGFRITAEGLRKAITPKTKAIIMAFPGNPTGAVMRAEHLAPVAELLRDTDIMVITDELYAELTYGRQRHVSIAALPGMKEHCIYVNGFSKAYAMTGWRLGYMCAPQEIMRIMVKIHQFGIICAPTTSQYAALVALRDGDDAIEAMRQEYDMRRKLLVNALNKMGLTCFEPEGAFYVFPSIKATGLSSAEFCEQLLYAQKVAVVPGTAFGDSGEGFVRISYSYSIEHLSEALKRINAFLEELKNKSNS